MSLFPGANAQIYRNEDGEVLGWDNTSYDPPEYDPCDDYYYTDDSPFDGDREGCIAAGEHGVNASQQSDGTWECDSCYTDCTPEHDAQADNYDESEDAWLDWHLYGE